MRNYDKEAYANGRLAGTFVRWKGKAIEVLGIGDRQVSAIELISGKQVVFPYKELDINPVPLGYANLQGKAVYVARSPMRNDWRQGARWQNLRWFEMKENKEEAPDLRPRIKEQLPKDVLGATIEGSYPSLGDVIKATTYGSAKFISKAWCRNFALTKNFIIEHKGQFEIGKLNPETRRYELKDEFWWAKEALEESMS